MNNTITNETGYINFVKDLKSGGKEFKFSKYTNGKDGKKEYASIKCVCSKDCKGLELVQDKTMGKISGSLGVSDGYTNKDGVQVKASMMIWVSEVQGKGSTNTTPSEPKKDIMSIFENIDNSQDDELPFA